MSEIDEKLNIRILEEKERSIEKREKEIEIQEKYIVEEINKINSSQNLKMDLPEKSKITLTHNYIETMPSYFKDIINCVSEMNSYEEEILKKEKIDIKVFKAYLISLATTISLNIFNSSNSSDIRIHFRYFNKSKNGYEKLVAIIGKKMETNEMTLIPFNTDNMILRSFECKRALICSINASHNYQSHNHRVWKDYLTYTFYNIEEEGIPLLSFGISVKDGKRYKDKFYFFNYIRFEEFLQEKIDILNTYFKIISLLYGGV